MIQGMIRWMLVFFLLAVSPSQAETGGFLQVSDGCRLEFPRDHGVHSGFRTEWWYYTGNLETADGRRFGFQFTIFRRQLRPPRTDPLAPGEQRSAWRTEQVYLGHAALSDISGNRHLQAETLGRGMNLLAGARHQEDTTRVFVRQWQVSITPAAHRLSVETPAFAYELELVPQKPPARHGRDGFSRKGLEPGQASCYYSFTRLKTSGRLQIGELSLPVSGLGWMDHEFSSAYLAPDLSGWDWFSIQLSDGSEVMLFALRHADGGISPVSSGTYIDRDGSLKHLAQSDFILEAGAPWQSPRSGIRYPLEWKIRIRPLGLQLDIAAALPDQEIRTEQTTGVTYWEGSIYASGTRNGQPVEGRGYLEMTGRGEKGFEIPL